MKWKVSGVWKSDGTDVAIEIDSATASGAESTAASRGILVESTEPVIPPAMPHIVFAQPAQPASPRCPVCGTDEPPERQPQGSVIVMIVLLLLMVLPGILYALLNSGYHMVCTQCGTFRGKAS